MFDTMTMTKAVGSICGSFLLFLLVSWGGNALFTVGGEHHGGEEIAQAYTIDTGEEEAPVETAADAPDFATLLASADAAAGEAVFKKCASCHKLDGNDGVGPHLNGVVGRNHGSIAGFQYSEAVLALAAEPWSPEALNAFLENPKANIVGTKMAFAGLPKPQDRANLIAYLTTTTP